MNDLNKISEVEKALELINCKLLGKNIWPLIRLSIVVNPISKFGRKEKLSLKSCFYHLLDLISIHRLWKMKSKNIFLTYGTDKSGKVLLNNRLVDKHFTPFKEKFGSKKISFIEFGYIDPSFPKFNSLNITLIYFLLKPVLNIYFKLKLKKGLNELFELLKVNKLIQVNLLESYIVDFYSKSFFFKYLLKHIIKPKNVFVKSFFNVTAMSIVSAANELKINTIEFQHGQQGENSLNYSNWNNVPITGFEMLPKYFWIWENRFKVKFDKWMLNQNFHKVIVGGNLWFNYFLELNESASVNFNKKAINVLYCLQYTELNPVVIKAMKQSKNILWHIRLHPRERHKIDVLTNEIMNQSINKSIFNLVDCNNNSFESIIPDIDVVVSEWSTVLYEAYCFRKKAITVSKFGKIAFEEFINEGSIYYAKDPKTLLELISEETLIKNSFYPRYNHENVKLLGI